MGVVFEAVGDGAHGTLVREAACALQPEDAMELADAGAPADATAQALNDVSPALEHVRLGAVFEAVGDGAHCGLVTPRGRTVGSDDLMEIADTVALAVAASDTRIEVSPVPLRFDELGDVCDPVPGPQLSGVWSDPYEGRDKCDRLLKNTGALGAPRVRPLDGWIVWEQEHKEGCVQQNLDTAMRDAQDVVARKLYRDKTQNKEVGGGGGAYYGERSLTPPSLCGFSGNKVVLSDNIVVANGAPRVEGWVNQLHVEF